MYNNSFAIYFPVIQIICAITYYQKSRQTDNSYQFSQVNLLPNQ